MDKPIFNGLLHTGQPDLEALYRVGKIPMVTRTNVVGAETAYLIHSGCRPRHGWMLLPRRCRLRVTLS